MNLFEPRRRVALKCAAILLTAFGWLSAQTAYGQRLDAAGNFNPIVPGYFADPTLKRFGDIFYLYATTDGNGGGRGPATVWVSKDFVDWTLVPMNWPTTPHYWAPDVIKRSDGRYYLLYNQPCSTFAGFSETPIGPWTPVTPGDGLIIKDRLVKNVITLDTQVFEDKDGTLYGYWGTWGIFPDSGCGFGVFNPDMKSFARLGMIPNTQAKEFFEGPLMLERNGVYYLTYSSGSCHDATYRVQYAVSSSPDGEFKMGPNNPILATSKDGTVHGPGHHSILKEGEDYFIIYHRHDIPVTPNGMHRQICADRLVFEADGVIKKVEPTHRGVGYLGPKPALANLAFASKATASSFYHDTLRHHEYRPEYAVDDNNATLWRPASNRMGHWLEVDLGAPRSVRRTQTQFEYGTWYYQYLIEASLDGKSWKVFADRRQNTRWGSPMTDDGDIQARYLRITVTGTEYPGLFGAIWNFKAFSEASADPLAAMADQAFDSVVTPNPNRPAAPRVSSAAATPSNSAPNLLVYLNAADLQLGVPVGAWTNLGRLGGRFETGDAKPAVGLAAGCKAVRFTGKQSLTASFPAPRTLAGNSSFTVAAWVNNPHIAESECILSWAGRGGPDGTTAQFGYGTHSGFGAVGHWGFADMGFRGGLPTAGQWHHLAVVFDGVIERVYVNGRLNSSAAKMLLMHEGRPIYLGASEPGTEHLDAYLASVRVYDGALDESEIEKLAADKPSADVLIHLDSGRLDYGPLKTWENQGSLSGAFNVTSQAPVVENVFGRVAVTFNPKQSFDLVLTNSLAPGDFTLLASVLNPTLEPGECPVEIESGDVNRIGLLAEPPTGGWQQLAVVYEGGQGRRYLNGRPAPGRVPTLPGAIRSIRLGGKSSFTGTISRVQWFQRALPATEIAQLHAAWKTEWQPPLPNPAAFVQKPTALDMTMIGMAAEIGRTEFSPLEYRFSRIGSAGEKQNGSWNSSPFFLEDHLPTDGRFSYNVTMRDLLGNVAVASAPVEVVTTSGLFQVFRDNFDAPRDFLAQGCAGTIWDGFLGNADESMPEAILAEVGALRLQSRGTAWDGGKPRGVFLYKTLAGDFVAEVRVADYAGLTTRKVPGNNDGGLMVRVPSVADAGPGEDLVQVNFFPIWNQGNMVTSLDGGRMQKGNQLSWDAHRHLQLIRHGNLFYCRTSKDGEHWQSLPGSPLERADMDGLALQVGLYHASYGAESSYVSFGSFRLVQRKASGQE
jgi:hypothetical protein